MDRIVISQEKVVNEIVSNKNQPDFENRVKSIIESLVRDVTLKTFETNLQINEPVSSFKRRI